MFVMKSVINLIILILLLFISQIAQSAEIQPRIIGGQLADNGEWPAAVALLAPVQNQPGFFTQFCGGSLVASKWVLTAAHCVDNIKTDPSQVFALTGATNLETQGDLIAVTNIIVHPGYQVLSPNDSDIALLELAQDAPAPAQVISLFTGSPAVGSLSTVVGWGTTVFDPNATPPSSNPSLDLLEVQVPIVDQMVCTNLYASATPPLNAQITSNMICAGDLGDGGEDSCQGDSGGPLMAEQGGVFQQVGVVSFGTGCALPEFPGVYTRVDNFRNWIISFTENTGAGDDGGGAISWLLLPLALLGFSRRRFLKRN
ncbi:MAG TPA: serine protease [Chromatiales bacterium]|nr:serine protease [Thiotrichales bacterium]HIP67438.1 serine protease [Chromatiales bacterium]